MLERIGWVSKEDGQLAMDLNGNKVIDDITELFGDDLISAYFKLSLLDSNDDKLIDENDDDFDSILLWQDRNSNGYSEKGELKTLRQAGIKNISLKTEADDRVIEGNTITETSQFTFADGRKGEVADVHYHNDDMDTWYKTKKAEYKASSGVYIDKFRTNALESFDRKINDSDFSKNTNDDWLAILVKAEYEKVVDSYKKKDDKKLENFLEKINLILQAKLLEHGKNCANKQEDVVKQVNKALMVDININIKREQKELLDDINARMVEESKNEVEELYEKNKYTMSQSVFDAEAAKIQERNREKFVLEHANKMAALKLRYDAIMSGKINLQLENNQQDFDMEKKDLIAILKKEGDKELEGRIHEEILICKTGKKGLKIVLQDQFFKQKELNNKNFEQLSDALKKEANSFYKFVLSEVLKEDSTIESFAELKDSFDDYVDDQEDDDINNSSETMDTSILFLPMMRGYGNMPAFHIAMTQNEKLKTMVTEFVGMKPSELDKTYEKIVDILYEWSGVSHIDENIRATAGGANIEARKVAFIEQLTGQKFKQLGAADFVGQHASTAVQKAWDIALVRTTKALLVQGPLATIFPKAQYSFTDDIVRLNSSFEDILEKLERLSSKHVLSYNFWIKLSYILASSREELSINIAKIKEELFKLAGFEIMIGEGMFQLVGDNADNDINGTTGSDYIKGLGGNDKLYGKKGSDHISGDEGDDHIEGNEGIDRLYGGRGNDKIYGGDGRDFIYGEEGDDELYGEDGDDLIEGGDGADILDGGEGNNTLSYGASPEAVQINLLNKTTSSGHASGDKFKNFANLGGSEFNDELIGDDEDNYINGEGGDDSISGGKGDDQLFGATGEDYIYGEEGNDRLSGFEGPDHFDGGEGIDTVSYRHPYSKTGVRVSLKDEYGAGGFATGDTYKNIENVEGSRFDDVIVGNDENNVLAGLQGDDRINCLDGDDTVVLGHGSNVVSGGKGSDTVAYYHSPRGVTIDLVEGAGGDGMLNEDHFEDFENVIGSNFNDKITGDDNNNILKGLDGDDHIAGGDGDDHIAGGKGADTIDGGDGSDTIDYSNELESGIRLNLLRQIVTGGSDSKGDRYKNIENAVGTKFNDHLVGDDGPNKLFGLDGDDYISGGNGDDLLCGGKGRNKLVGGKGNDRFLIGEGENTIEAGIGDNTIDYRDSEDAVHVELEKLEVIKSTGERDKFDYIRNVTGSKHDDIIKGDEMDNHIDGDDGNDYIDGGEGNDTLHGGEGKNKLLGGTGDDVFLVYGGSNNIDGGDGKDTISYAQYLGEQYKFIVSENLRINSQSETLLPTTSQQKLEYPFPFQKKGLTINLSDGEVIKSESSINVFVDIENVIGTHYNDAISGDAQNNVLDGLNGDDTIYGGAGNDTLRCGRGLSNLYGEKGNDIFVIKNGRANIYGGEGIDLVDFSLYPLSVVVDLEKETVSYEQDSRFHPNAEEYDLKDVKQVKATRYDDLLFDSKGNDTIHAGHGKDIIHLTGGNDHLNLVSGYNHIYLSGSGTKIVWGGVDKDIYHVSTDLITINKIDLVIFGFDLSYIHDKIDLSSFKDIHSLDDLLIKTYSDSEANVEETYTLIELGENQQLALYGVETQMLSSDSFIF
jgi:Ca2+-binding RTX toxin-like protein